VCRQGGDSRLSARESRLATRPADEFLVVLADWVTESCTVRYDPRDISEIRVWPRTADREKFLSRAICVQARDNRVAPEVCGAGSLSICFWEGSG
jgi:Mu transposase, C-terminal